MQDSPLHVSDYSILNLNTKIEQFLVYYLHFFFQSKIKIKFGYDSRIHSLCIEGNTNDVKQSYQIMKDMISKYKAAQYSLGFPAASVMNFFVRGIADRPNIKFFDSKKVEELNKFPGIKIQITKNKTFMVGPKKQVEKLMEDIGRWIAGSVVDAIVKQQQVSKQIKQNIKQVKRQKIEQIVKNKEIQNLPPPPQMQQKRISQQISGHVPQQKLQIKKSPSQPAIIQHNEQSAQIANKANMMKKKQEDKLIHIINVNNPKQVSDSVANQQVPIKEQIMPASQPLDGVQYLSNNVNDNRIKVSFSLPIDQKLEQCNAATIFIQNKMTQMLRFKLPQFILVQSEIRHKQIVVSGIVFDMQIKKIGDDIIEEFRKSLVLQVIQVNIAKGSFFMEIRKNHQFKLFACDGRKKVIHVYQTTIGQQKIDQLNNVVKEIIKKYSFPADEKNKKINIIHNEAQSPANIQPILPVNIPQAQLQPFVDDKPQVSPPQADNNKKILKKHFRFPYYIGQQIWNFAEELAEKINEININFNPQSKFYGGSSHIHIFQDSSFSAKGPQKELKQFATAIQNKILALKQQKYIRNIEITESMYKKMTHQYERVKKIEGQHKVKIINNPQIIANYQTKQILTSRQNKKHQILGIKGSLCDLFIDNFGTILIFDRERDLQKYRSNFSNLKNIIQDKVFSIMGVCERKSLKLSSFIQETATSYIKQINPQKLKIFIFAQLISLKQLVWDLIEIVDRIKVNIFQFYLVFQQGSQQQTKNIPDRYKRWYAIINDSQIFYSQEGNTAINKAIQNGQNQIVLNSDHIAYNRATHTVYIDRHMFSHYKYKFGLDIKYRDCQDWIQFDYEGKTYKLGDCRLKEIRQAQKNKEKQIELSISLFKIDIKQMKQVNVWNGYQRDIDFQEVSLVQKNLMISYQSSKYITQIISASKEGIINAAKAIDAQFSKICKQILKIDNNVKQVCLQKLYKLCSSYNVQISKISNTQFEILFEIGQSSIDVIRKYVQMIKSDDINVVYPPTWKHDQKNPEVYVEIEADEKSQEYQDLAKVFPYKIVKLKRIQNYNAYSRYFNEKKFLEKLNGGKTIKEMLLYHGTRTMDPSLITADKEITFNINYSADKNYMGRATYFAERAQYSHNYRYKMNVGTGVMLLCVVQVGDSQKCPKLNVNYLDTDFKDASKTIRYESMTAFYDGSQIYTIYKNNRAYPMYRIQYKV